jgi:hypothetical protein
MQTIEIAPGLRLTPALYDVAQVGVTAYAPDLAPLTWEQFTEPMSWWLILDGRGRLSKAELTLTESRDRTVKINIWHAPDIRSADGRPAPGCE